MKHTKDYILESFELFYEEMERKPVKTATKQTKKSSKVEAKPPVKATFRDYVNKARGKFDNVTKKLNLRRKNVKKVTKADKKLAREQKIRGIIGIGLLFVVVSIAYSTYQTNLFVDGWQMVIALTPQVIFAVAISIYAFYKIYK